MRHILFTIVLLIISQTSFAEKQRDTIIESKEPIRKNVEIQNTTNQQIETYKILYEEVKLNNTRLIESFQWSIGSILLIILAIFGGSIYFNFRYNKNELSNLLQKVDMKIQEIKTDLIKKQDDEIEKLELALNERSKKISDDFNTLQSNTLNRFIEEIKEFKVKTDNNLQKYHDQCSATTNKLNDDFSSRIENLSNKYQDQLDSFNENYKQQINTLNISINKQVDTINASTEKQINSLTEILNTKVEGLNKDFIKVNESLQEKDKKLNNLSSEITNQLDSLKKNYQRDVARTNALLWEHKGVPGNALRYHIEEITLMLDLKWNKIDFYLKEVIENLNKVVKIDDYDYNVIVQFVEKIPKEYIVEINNIKELTEQKRK